MKKTLASILLSLLAIPAVASATTFNPNLIITDEDLLDYDSMNIADIFEFLNENKSPLSAQFFLDHYGKRKSAVSIIYQSALENGISPKFILTVLQKEQSLIENPAPTSRDYDWAAGYGVCDDCSTNDPSIQDYKGFGNQVHLLGAINKKYLEKPQLYNCAVNMPCVIDATTIIPLTRATANLYNYTPHISGNESFHKIWNKYWSGIYPDGTLAKAYGDEAIWYIQNGKKRRVASMSVLLSRFDAKNLVLADKDAIDALHDGPPLQFPNYSLLKTEDGKIYLLVDDTIRYITSPEVFRMIGYNAAELITVGYSDISHFTLGENITLSSIHPTGALLQDPRTNGVYFVENGIKHPIYSEEILHANFPNRAITRAPKEEIDNYETGAPVLFRDGTLMKSSEGNAVYVISKSLRLPISSGELFEKMGYSWDNVITTKPFVVEAHPLGNAL